MEAASLLNQEEKDTSLLNALLTDELLSRIFAFLTPEGLATTTTSTTTTTTTTSHSDEDAAASFDGVRHVILVCRRFRNVLYQAQFWKNALLGSNCHHDKNTNNHPSIGQSILLATTAAPENNGKLHFHGFVKIDTQTPKIPREERFLVHEHWSGKRLILSIVTMEPNQVPRELVQQLHAIFRLWRQGKLQISENNQQQQQQHQQELYGYYKVGISIGERLVFVRCLDEQLMRHLDVDLFRSGEIISPQTTTRQWWCWEHRQGSLPSTVRQKWSSIVDWIFEVCLVFRLETNTTFRASQLMQYAYLQPCASLFCPADAQLVAAAATFIVALLNERAEGTLSLTDLSHSMDNRWSPQAIWSCVKILLTLHADRIGEPTIFDCLFFYYHFDNMKTLTRLPWGQLANLALVAVSCSSLMEEYPSRVAAACVFCLARFPLHGSTHHNNRNGAQAVSDHVVLWPDALAEYSGLSLESLPLEQARVAMQETLQARRFLITRGIPIDSSHPPALLFLPTSHDLEVYRRRAQSKRVRMGT